MDPYRQLTPTEMRQVDHAVAGIMAIVKRAKRSAKVKYGGCNEQAVRGA